VREPDFFERADALGVSVVGDDYNKLLDAIYEHETKLMILRHELSLHVAGVVNPCAGEDARA
jgi:hypothetical protein